MIDVRVVEVIYHHEPDGWWAESPDIDGYGATAPTIEELRELVHDGLPFFLDEAVDLDERYDTATVMVFTTVDSPLAPLHMTTTAERVSTTAGRATRVMQAA